MRIVINSPLKVRKMTQIFHYLKDLSTEVNINCSSDGIYAQGMDSAHISLFEIKLQAEWGFTPVLCKFFFTRKSRNFRDFFRDFLNLQRTDSPHTRFFGTFWDRRCARLNAR